MKQKKLLHFILAIICVDLIAGEDLKLKNLKSDILMKYDSLLMEKFSKNLIINYQNYKEFPDKYWTFLNETFLDNWDFDATTKALIGNEIFKGLLAEEFNELSRALQMTFIRYAFESLLYYDEQRLNVIDININEQKTYAWLKINMKSPRFPDIYLDLLLKRTGIYDWKGIDFRFKGITYVNLKKKSYRQDLEELKFEGLLRKLEDKNKVFFNDLCQREANYIDPKRPPCL